MAPLTITVWPYPAAIQDFHRSTQIYTAEATENLKALGDYFRCSLQDVSRGTKMVATSIGAVLTVHFINHDLTPRCTADLEAKASIGLKKLYWYWCFK